MTVGPWDAAIVVAVSLQCTVIAYVRPPRWKAAVMGLPVPFTTASLALGQPINTTHISGTVLLLGFVFSVRWLRVSLCLPIALAIGGPAVGYCLVAAALAPVLPRGNAPFYGVAALALALSAALHLGLRHRPEPGHRSPLPLWVKLPALTLVIAGVVCLKQVLQGFMALFPMVTVVTLYEARHSLWRVCRQMPAFLLAFVPFIAVVRLAQASLGLGGGLALGWAAFLAILAPVLRTQWAADRAAESAALADRNAAPSPAVDPAAGPR